MKIINVCGYGNTGCTSQVDVLCDYEGVFGVLSPLNQTLDGKSAYHEIGVLKCLHSIGGLLIAKLGKHTSLPNRAEIRNSLQGLHPSERAELNFGAKLHLDMRDLMVKQYGESYRDLVENTVAYIPENCDSLTIEELFIACKNATHAWINGLISIIDETPSLKLRNDNEEVQVLGLKNDPPGAFPLLAALIPNGLTSAILRDPRDTTYDFNRHYQLGHTDDTVRNHCIHYNAQINSARSQIKRFRDLIGDCYFVHDFESLVQSDQHRHDYVKRMVGQRDKIRHYFDPQKSAQNIGHYTNMTQEHIDYVTTNCLSNYLEYKDFLVEHNMLMHPGSSK
jgi:hypothetical protein